jgi:hypothetical protein
MNISRHFRTFQDVSRHLENIALSWNVLKWFFFPEIMGKFYQCCSRKNCWSVPMASLVKFSEDFRTKKIFQDVSRKVIFLGTSWNVLKCLETSWNILKGIYKLYSKKKSFLICPEKVLKRSNQTVITENYWTCVTERLERFLKRLEISIFQDVSRCSSRRLHILKNPEMYGNIIKLNFIYLTLKIWQS